ncbi:MAG: HD domain-containing protein [Pelolinea sp.]|nr:HD domain-containing protein [Pelolinea sp.]
MKINELLSPELEQLLLSQQDICGDIFLVGGAIRNSYLRKEIQDIDLVVRQNPAKIAKRIADFFHGDYYVMDKTRGTARALIILNCKKLKVDVAQMVGDSINGDLAMRDFTINAIAMQIPVIDEVIDPLGGESDIFNGNLRPCSPTSFEDDPVRVIRAIRFINEFDLTFDPIDIDGLRTAAKNLDLVSGERKRDEIINILEKTDVKQSLKLMLDFEILKEIFPEVAFLEKLDLDTPHVHNAWEHTCQVVDYCQQLLGLISNCNAAKEISPRIRQAYEELQKFQKLISADLSDSIASERSKSALLLFAGIYHDAGKGLIEPVYKDGRKSYPNHAKVSSDLIRDKAKTMGFSKSEIEFLTNIVRFHMKLSRPSFIDLDEKDVQIHRFFNNVGPAGIFVGLIHLADVLATYEQTLTEDRWERAISSVYNIFDAYYFQFDRIIHPPKILDGYDLIKEFDLPPGKNFRKLLGLVAEEQVRGGITSKNDAKKFIGGLLTDERKQGNL